MRFTCRENKSNDLLLLIISAAKIFILAVMAPVEALRVAVLGSGISGSTAARTLADGGIKVTVFEAGFGMGGRTSTRITRDDARYQFDHGAQYIGSPKTDAFGLALQDWRDKGWVKPWTGSFATENNGKVVLEVQGANERYVGSPGMHSICQNLLHHENITVVLQTRANAEIAKDKDGYTTWKLTSGKAKKDLGSFDWLVASDRLSAAHYRRDLGTNGANEFKQIVKKVKNVRCLTAMLVLQSPLNLPLDGVRFSGKDDRFGALGWIARDTSKPGRKRKDQQECWVLQSHPEAAEQVLASMKGKHHIDKIRQRAKEILVQDFRAAIPHLALACQAEEITLPPVIEAIGHRWGAAFPITNKQPTLSEKNCDVYLAEHLVSCGDYYGNLTGRIEGAYLSGLAGAMKLKEQFLSEENLEQEGTIA